MEVRFLVGSGLKENIVDVLKVVVGKEELGGGGFIPRSLEHKATDSACVIV